MLSGEAPKRKKPNKKKRAPAEDPPTVSQSDQKVNKSMPKASTDPTDPTDPRQKLRDRIKSMLKDRQRGSQACEENANHEY